MPYRLFFVGKSVRMRSIKRGGRIKMKQKFLKRVMALALSAALVLPGFPVDVSAQESQDLSANVSEFAEFVITNPGDQVSAYVGQPLVFYVRAKEAVSFTMSGGGRFRR